MKKMSVILAVISLWSVVFAAEASAVGPVFRWGVTTSETIDLLGSPVINPAGKMLGTVNAFVIDSQGHVAFAILWQGVLEDVNAGRYVAVPLSALSISGKEPAEMTVVLNVDKRTMDSAPGFDKPEGLNNLQWAARIYRYFGQTPYWTEEETGEAGPATNSPESGDGFQY